MNSNIVLCKYVVRVKVETFYQFTFYFLFSHEAIFRDKLNKLEKGILHIDAEPDVELEYSHNVITSRHHNRPEIDDNSMADDGKFNCF